MTATLWSKAAATEAGRQRHALRRKVALSSCDLRQRARGQHLVGVTTPQPRCQHQQQRGATHAARQAMGGGARKATAGSAPGVACRAILVGLPCVGSNKL
eukprot:scaffold82729_cov62-Phaeocystis_antarctica.AAC.2